MGVETVLRAYENYIYSGGLRNDRHDKSTTTLYVWRYRNHRCNRDDNKRISVRISFVIGNATKYISRSPYKNGVEDLKKHAGISTEQLKNGVRDVKAKYEYVVYKGDEILSAGTANEIIEMGITETHKELMKQTNRTDARLSLLKYLLRNWRIKYGQDKSTNRWHIHYLR